MAINDGFRCKPFAHLAPKVFAGVDKAHAHRSTRVARPNHVRGDFEPPFGMGRLQANARKFVLHDAHGSLHGQAALAQIDEDEPAIASAFQTPTGGWDARALLIQPPVRPMAANRITTVSPTPNFLVTLGLREGLNSSIGRSKSGHKSI
jgi:hypothetical protein